jgi:hypothetical protein
MSNNLKTIKDIVILITKIQILKNIKKTMKIKILKILMKKSPNKQTKNDFKNQKKNEEIQTNI